MNLGESKTAADMQKSHGESVQFGPSLVRTAHAKDKTPEGKAAGWRDVVKVHWIEARFLAAQSAFRFGRALDTTS